MDDFKLKSIDEFDSLFAESVKADAAKAQPQAAPVRESLIPEINKDAAPAAEQAEPARAVPPAVENPLYTPEKMNSDNVVPFVYNPPEDYDDEEPVKKKSSGGALAGKIIAIVLLCATIVVFLLGCFVSVFLDNNGLNIGGTTLNTLSADISKLNISKGDLIVAKKVSPEEYTQGSLVAVPSTDGCLVVQVSSATVSGDSAVLTVNDLTGGYGQTLTYSSDSTLGVVQSYIPALGGIIGFAIDNAILVCVLFILLAALWCLILVLIEKSESKKRAEPEEAAENDDEPTPVQLDDNFDE